MGRIYWLSLALSGCCLGRSMDETHRDEDMRSNMRSSVRDGPDGALAEGSCPSEGPSGEAGP